MYIIIMKMATKVIFGIIFHKNLDIVASKAELKIFFNYIGEII